MTYTCPVCGYGMADEPADCNICPCCGTEFGISDFGWTHEELRCDWIKTGPAWWSDIADRKPSNWDPFAQMDAAGLSY